MAFFLIFDFQFIFFKTVLDRKINPGLTSLTWASKGVTDYYIKECRRHSHDIRQTGRG